VQLFKSYKMSPIWFRSEGYRFLHIYGIRFYAVFTYIHTVYTVFEKVIYGSGQPYKYTVIYGAYRYTVLANGIYKKYLLICIKKHLLSEKPGGSHYFRRLFY